MDLKLEDSVVLVTGASGGIGRALARAFAGEGARLALTGHRAFPELCAWTDRQEWRERALPLEVDVTAPAQVSAAFEQALARFGRIDHCIANAGAWPPEDLALHRLPEERVRTVLEVNLLGAFWTARAFLQCLERTGARADGRGASLLFTGSTAGRFGERGHSDYAAAKAALVGLMHSLANEIVALDPLGRVNVVEPGWTVTEMTRRNVEQPGVVEKIVRTMPLRQLGRAEDVARTALFLTSPAAARHVSGQVVTVAGGMQGRVRWEEGEVDAASVRARLRPGD